MVMTWGTESHGHARAGAPGRILDNPNGYQREKVRGAVYRTLAPREVSVTAAVMDLSMPDFPHDNWRSTPQAFSPWMSPPDPLIVGCQGYSLQLHTLSGIGFKEVLPPGPERMEDLFQTSVRMRSRYSCPTT